MLRKTILLVAGFASILPAQSQTRRELIEEARTQKAARLEPDAPGTWEQRLILVKDNKVIERITAGYRGVRVKMGGMPNGSGFALGPNYFRDDLARGELVLDTSLQASTRRWLKYEVLFRAPSFAGNKLFWESSAIHQDYNSLDYYGPGPDSEKTCRSNYRLEDTSFDTLFGVRPFKYLRLGTGVGYLLTNVGRGQNDRFISADRQFSSVPAMQEQTNFFRTGVLGQFDYRDTPAGARSGGNYLVRYDHFNDNADRGFNFQRLDFEAQQYIPFFNKRRVIALRARSLQTFTSADNRVPFYQQAVLGGDDLRGFRPYRFQDSNMMAFSAEYRWEVFSGLDMAVFGDAGQVSPKRWYVNLNSIETSVGFGLRFNARNAPFLRLDVGFSHEGFQIFMRFREIWAQRPRSTSSAPHIY